MQRNTIQFGDHADQTITLVAQGTVWPTAIEVDGESWERTDTCIEVSKSETVRIYEYVGKRFSRRSG